MDQDEESDVGVVYLHEVGALHSLENAQGETTVLFDERLEITIEPTQMDWNFAEPRVGGRSLGAEFWPHGCPELDDDEVLALCVFAPFGAHAENPSGIPVRLANDWGLDPATTVQIYELSKDTGVFVDAGPAIVSEQGDVIESLDQGLSALTWMIGAHNPE